MPFKVSFVIDDEEQVKAFIEDAGVTNGLVAYVNNSGDDIEIQTSELKYEEV